MPRTWIVKNQQGESSYVAAASVEKYPNDRLVFKDTEGSVVAEIDREDWRSYYQGGND